MSNPSTSITEIRTKCLGWNPYDYTDPNVERPRIFDFYKELEEPYLIGLPGGYPEQTVRMPLTDMRKALENYSCHLNKEYPDYTFEIENIDGYGQKLKMTPKEIVQESAGVILDEAISPKDLKAARKRCEERIYKAMKIVDPTGQNTEYYKRKFAGMSDKEFLEFFKQDFPLKFQTKVFEIDPKMTQIIDLLKYLGVPVLEKVSMPFLYTNKQGEPVMTHPVLVVYLPIKRLKQMVQKKTGYSVNISKRDYRTGLLIDTDKNGNSTDREFESLVVMGFDNTLKELATVRADAMRSKNQMMQQIGSGAFFSMKDVDIENDDSIARNLISAYLLGAHLNSNLVNVDLMLPRTIRKKNAKQGGLSRQ